MSDPDYILDVSELDERDGPAVGPRSWIGVRFDCCSVYHRIYRNREGTAYVGRCPRCGRAVRVRIGSDGVSTRFFRAE